MSKKKIRATFLNIPGKERYEIIKAAIIQLLNTHFFLKLPL